MRSPRRPQPHPGDRRATRPRSSPAAPVSALSRHTSSIARVSSFAPTRAALDERVDQPVQHCVGLVAALGLLAQRRLREDRAAFELALELVRVSRQGPPQPADLRVALVVGLVEQHVAGVHSGRGRTRRRLSRGSAAVALRRLAAALVERRDARRRAARAAPARPPRPGPPGGLPSAPSSPGVAHSAPHRFPGSVCDPVNASARVSMPASSSRSAPGPSPRGRAPRPRAPARGRRPRRRRRSPRAPRRCHRTLARGARVAREKRPASPRRPAAGRAQARSSLMFSHSAASTSPARP